MALNMYYSDSTAQCVFAMSPSLRRYSCNAAKENGGEKIVLPIWTGPRLWVHNTMP